MCSGVVNVRTSPLPRSRYPVLTCRYAWTSLYAVPGLPCVLAGALECEVTRGWGTQRHPRGDKGWCNPAMRRTVWIQVKCLEDDLFTMTSDGRLGGVIIEGSGPAHYWFDDPPGEEPVVCTEPVPTDFPVT